MSPFIVGIDIDDVVADLPKEWLRRYNRDWDDVLYLVKREMTVHKHQQKEEAAFWLTL